MAAALVAAAFEEVRAWPAPPFDAPRWVTRERPRPEELEAVPPRYRRRRPDVRARGARAGAAAARDWACAVPSRLPRRRSRTGDRAGLWRMRARPSRAASPSRSRACGPRP